ncbi:unnamed protein product [Closterium sp. NIES-64]|nr:unnamed protein product [Closterium sp. NIES-64]
MRGGVDSEGRQYASADEMWRQEAGERAVSAGEGKSEEGAMEAEMGGKKREWYDKGVKYWEGVEASVDGVLGGYGAVSSTDAAGSAAFLHEVYGAQLDAARSQGRPLVALGACRERGGDGEERGSKPFLLHAAPSPVPFLCLPFTAPPSLVADCGAGIGRVTKEFLLHVFNEVGGDHRVTKQFLLHVFAEVGGLSSRSVDLISLLCLHSQVDLVEPVRHFIDAARDHLASPPSSAASPAASHRAVNFFCCPLQVLPSQVLPSQVLPSQVLPSQVLPSQEFSPDAERYDVVWVQWCIGHLTDADLIAFLHRCLAGLRPGGIIVLKENTCQKGFVLDKADSSVTRSDAYFRDLFKQANLQLLKSKVQRGFPSELFVVKMYALAAHPTAHGGVAGRTRQRSKRPNQPAVIY